MTGPEDSRKRAEIEVMIALSGPIGERMAVAGSEPGFKRRRTAEELTAHHEASHLCMAAACGRHCYSGTIVPDRSVRIQKTSYSGGFAQYGALPVQSDESRRITASRTWHETDFRTAARYCQLLAGRTDWRATLAVLRRLNAQTTRLIESNWLFVVMLAGELLRQKTLDQAAIERILKPTATAAQRNIEHEHAASIEEAANHIAA